MEKISLEDGVSGVCRLLLILDTMISECSGRKWKWKSEPSVEVEKQ